MNGVHAAGGLKVNAARDHAGQDKDIDFLPNFSATHLDVEGACEIKSDIVRRFQLVSDSPLGQWRHLLIDDRCFKLSTFGAAKLNLFAEDTHADDGKLVSDGSVHGVNADRMLMINMSGFDNESGVICFSMKDYGESFFVGESGNVSKSGVTSDDTSWIQKWVELQNLAPVISSNFCKRF